jgi:kinesin family protein 5
MCLNPEDDVSLSSVQLVDQNSALKKEAGIAERKLLARNERIQNLEALLQDADRRLSIQNQKFEAQLQAVKERLDQARGRSHIYSLKTPVIDHESLASKAATTSTLSFGRIAKPLRGGGGSTTTANPVPTSASSANPLARLQEEAGSVFRLSYEILGAN